MNTFARIPTDTRADELDRLLDSKVGRLGCADRATPERSPTVSALRGGIADAVPEFQHRSPFDWGVIVWGGTDPRTGIAQRPLEFSYFAGHYSRAQIEQKAAELADWHKRDKWAAQAPVRKLARGQFNRSGL